VEGFDFETARRMVQVATGMRKNLSEHKCSFFLSTADLVMWAKFTEMTGDIHKSAEIAVYGKAPVEDVGLIREIVGACIGGARS